jgi:hypothetical protein
MSSASFDTKALKEACHHFEAKYGVEAFLDTMATIMRDRLADHGLDVEFFDDEIADHDEKKREGGCNWSVPGDRSSHR